MYIHGKRGILGKQGFTLKNPHGSLKGWFVYVWDKGTYDAEQVKRVRTLKGNNNYSKVKWKSVGKYDDPQTFEKYYQHIVQVYGEDITKEEVQKQLEEKHQEMEQKRLNKLAELNTVILRESHLRGMKTHEIKLADSLAEANRRIKKWNQ